MARRESSQCGMWCSPNTLVRSRKGGMTVLAPTARRVLENRGRSGHCKGPYPRQECMPANNRQIAGWPRPLAPGALTHGSSPTWELLRAVQRQPAMAYNSRAIAAHSSNDSRSLTSPSPSRPRSQARAGLGHQSCAECASAHVRAH
jgi:hypothetical protein